MYFADVRPFEKAYFEEDPEAQQPRNRQQGQQPLESDGLLEVQRQIIASALKAHRAILVRDHLPFGQPLQRPSAARRGQGHRGARPRGGAV